LGENTLPIKKGKAICPEFFKTLKYETVNLRSCKFLFDAFMKAFPEMKLSWQNNWDKVDKHHLKFLCRTWKVLRISDLR